MIRGRHKTLLYAGTVLQDGTGLIALQWRDNAPGVENPGMVTTFGGLAEGAETAHAAAVRELQEEVDLSSRPVRLSWLLTLDKHRPDGSPIRCILFLGRIDDVRGLSVYEGQGTVLGSPAELLADNRLTDTCRSAVQALLEQRGRTC